MRPSFRAFMEGLIDYAGMFPPAKLPLAEAARNYARYRRERDAWMLGRFICPAAQLGELGGFVNDLFASGPPLAVAVLGRGGGSAAEYRGNLAADGHDVQAFREAWTAAGHEREPRVSVSRSIFALVDDRDRAYFGRDNQSSDQVGYLDAQTKAIFGRSYAAEPDVLVKELAGDTAIQAADTLLLTVPDQLGVDYNAHAIESILRYVAPELGWR